jgi:hypothetical protein
MRPSTRTDYETPSGRAAKRLGEFVLHCWHLSLPDLSAAHGRGVNPATPISRSRRFGLRASTESIPETVQRGANCTTTSARSAAQRSAGLSICVQISLVSRLAASTTGISRLPWRRSGRRRCALGQCCQRAFSISRAVDRVRARVKSLSGFAAAHEFVVGTSRQFAGTQHFGRLRSEADIGLSCAYRNRFLRTPRPGAPA